MTKSELTKIIDGCFGEQMRRFETKDSSIEFLSELFDGKEQLDKMDYLLASFRFNKILLQSVLSEVLIRD